MKKLLSVLLALALLLSLSAVSPGAAAAENSPVYVLMNIPYGEFYEGEGVSGVDAVSSATLNKPRTGTLAGGSYHVNTDGSDITGLIYPVEITDPSLLQGLKQITDDSSVEITVTNRGQTVTTTYSGADALFESESYSYYVLSEKPAFYKTMTVSEGVRSFSPVQGQISQVDGASGSLSLPARHAEVEIALSGTTGINQGDKISAVVLTFDDGGKMGLKHIENLWRAVEIGGSLKELAGKTIANIRYYTPDAVIDFPVSISVPNAGYVLMNIPYDQFYAAEGVSDVDAVTCATKKAYNSSLAAGSYHNGEDTTYARTDILGITYPVFVEDISRLKGAAQADEAALFAAGDHAYAQLGAAPASYKALSISENGAYSFGAATGRVSQLADIETTVTVLTKRGDYQIDLRGDNASALSGSTVYGVILTTSGGNKYALRHLENIWRGVELALCTGHTDTIKDGALTPVNRAYAPLEGATVTDITYFTKDAAGVYRTYKIASELKIPNYPTAYFNKANALVIDGLSAEDAATATVGPDSGADKYYSATVYSGVGTAKKEIASRLPIRDDGVIELGKKAAGGKYTVEIIQTNTRKNEDAVVVALTAVKSASSTNGPSDDIPDITTEKVTNADGSVTTTVTNNRTGQVTQTTELPDGTVAAKVTDKNGNVTSMSAEVSPTAAATSGSSGKPVALPLTAKAARNATGATPLEITIPNDATKPVQIEIPVNNVTPGVVAYIINSDGRPELMKDCLVSDKGVVIVLEGSAEVIIADNSKNFRDVSGRWSEQAIDFVTAREIFNGTSAATFDPQGAMTRGMIAQVLYNFDKEAKPQAANAFSDVDSSKWYADAANWAAAQGIVMGYADGAFRGDDLITREQLVTILYRYAQLQGRLAEASQSGALNFSDADAISSYALPAMNWAVAEGLITGFSDGTLRPQGTATREQLAAIMMRFVSLI